MSAQTPSLRLIVLIFLSGSSLMMTGCATTGGANVKADATKKVLAQQMENQTVSDSLPAAEKAYKNNPDNVNNAIRYSRALRNAGRLSRASIVITSFAKDDRKPNAAAKTEYAAVQIGLGNYDAAAEAARKSLSMNDKSWQTYHLLGIALDAKGDNANAEKALRKALELAPPEQQTAILNNLGLNLATQGFLDEAAETLRKALATAPDRAEVERNLRIVSALRQSGGRAPSYMQKARDAAMKKDAAADAAAQKSSVVHKPSTDTPVTDKSNGANEESWDDENDDEEVPAPVKKQRFN